MLSPCINNHFTSVIVQFGKNNSHNTGSIAIIYDLERPRTLFINVLGHYWDNLHVNSSVHRTGGHYYKRF